MALVKGRLSFLLPPFMDPVATLGEGGKVKGLASHAEVPIYNWDLPKEQLAQQLSPAPLGQASGPGADATALF